MYLGWPGPLCAVSRAQYTSKPSTYAARPRFFPRCQPSPYPLRVILSAAKNLSFLFLNGRDQNNEEAALREYNEQRFTRRFSPFYWGVPLVLLTLVVFGAAGFLGGTSSKGAPQDQSTASAQAKDSETTNWKTLKSKWGWKIKYPPDWKPFSGPEAAPPVSGLVEFYGPFDCGHERCPFIQIDSDVNQGKVKEPTEEETESKKNNPNLFFRRRFQLGGFPATDACWYEPKANGGQLVRGIAVFHKEREIEITYLERGPDKATIKTPADWKYVATFDKILSTMSFYDVPDSVWPTP
jgi:hypothetical protein